MGYDGYVVHARVKGQTYDRVRSDLTARDQAESVRKLLARRKGYRDAYLTLSSGPEPYVAFVAADRRASRLRQVPQLTYRISVDSPASPHEALPNRPSRLLLLWDVDVREVYVGHLSCA
jgi:hypothetical protein